MDSENNYKYTYASHPRFIENKTLNEISIELLEGYRNNLLNKLFEKTPQEKRSIIQEQKDSYKTFEDAPILKIGRAIRNNTRERMTTRVQDLYLVYETVERKFIENTVPFSFEALFGDLIQSFFEIDYRNWLDQLLSSMPVNSDQDDRKPNTVNLKSIFNPNNNSFQICLELLQEHELTIDGEPNPDIKKGRAGKLIGLISAIKETPGMLILDKPRDLQLLKYFNSYLRTSYKTFSKRNEDYPGILDISKRYIKSHFKK